MANIYIVNHTHWDREWYKTKEQFLIHLKAGVEKLIEQFEQNQIEKFFFDGQTIIIEDLKQVLSDSNYQKFISFIKEGKIEIGPWYVLADEGLIDEVGFETNLKLGISICDNLDVKHSGVLYMPDTFGHNAKMPSIAKKFNINHAIIHRGLDLDVVDANWIDDNHQLKTIVLPTREGYYQTLFHHDNILEIFEKYVVDFQKANKNADVLIMNGCDHTFIPYDFKTKLELLKTSYPEHTFKEVNLSEFFEQTSYKFNKEISGEFRNKSKAFLLPGVLSTRYYLKRDNRILSDKFTHQYEKLINYYNLHENEKNTQERISKLIVKNHPHDSICGCSIDEVHTQMQVRTKKAMDLVNTSCFEIFNKFYDQQIMYQENTFNNNLIVVNHSNEKNNLVSFKVELDENFIKDGNFILSKNGKKFNVDVINIVTEEKLLHNYHNEPTYKVVKIYDCYAFLELDLLVNEFEIEKISTSNKEISQISKFLNEQLVIGGKKYDVLNYKVISDRGDSYNFDPLGQYQEFNNKLISQTNLTNIESYVFESRCNFLTELDAMRNSRTGTCEDIIIKTVITVCKNTSNIYIKATINNIHKNIKIVKSYTNINSLFTDNAGEVRERTQISNITYNAINKNEEVLYNQVPTISAILLNKEFQVSHLGNNEVEIIESEVYHTLFRGVDYLSRRDLKSRNGGAGPSFSTPEAQCLIEMDFDFVITANNELIKNKHLILNDFYTYQFSKKND